MDNMEIIGIIADKYVFFLARLWLRIIICQFQIFSYPVFMYDNKLFLCRQPVSDNRTPDKLLLQVCSVDLIKI